MNEELLRELIVTVEGLGKATFTDWLPIILSVVAAAIAIFIPMRIAKNQNKIALFDKLYAAYSQLLYVKSFAKVMEDFSFADKENPSITQNLFALLFETNFGYHPDFQSFDTRIRSAGLATGVLTKNQTKASMVPLLISKTVEEKELCITKMDAMYEAFFSLVTDAITANADELVDAEKLKEDFIAKSKEFFSLYSSAIEDALLCNSK